MVELFSDSALNATAIGTREMTASDKPQRIVRGKVTISRCVLIFGNIVQDYRNDARLRPRTSGVQRQGNRARIRGNGVIWPSIISLDSEP